MAFELHHRLAADCFDIGALGSSELLLMNDSRFPWCILVPRLTGLRELHDVPRSQRGMLFDEIEAVSVALQALVSPHKINVAALGNQVPQLHIHVIARKTDDAAWPAPVWGSGSATPYSPGGADELMKGLARRLAPALRGSA